MTLGSGTTDSVIAIKRDADLSSDLFERWIKDLFREKVLHDGLHDGKNVSVITTAAIATLIQS